jgi:hypothetical protein
MQDRCKWYEEDTGIIMFCLKVFRSYWYSTCPSVFMSVSLSEFIRSVTVTQEIKFLSMQQLEKKLAEVCET